jgi:hypothetical protein
MWPSYATRYQSDQVWDGLQRAPPTPMRSFTVPPACAVNRTTWRTRYPIGHTRANTRMTNNTNAKPQQTFQRTGTSAQTPPTSGKWSPRPDMPAIPLTRGLPKRTPRQHPLLTQSVLVPNQGRHSVDVKRDGSIGPHVHRDVPYFAAWPCLAKSADVARAKLRAMEGLHI